MQSPGAWAPAGLCGRGERYRVPARQNQRFLITVASCLPRLEIGGVFLDYSEGWGLGKVCQTLSTVCAGCCISCLSRSEAKGLWETRPPLSWSSYAEILEMPSDCLSPHPGPVAPGLCAGLPKPLNNGQMRRLGAAG